MADEFFSAVHHLVQRAPENWLDEVTKALCGLAPTAAMEFVIQRMPGTMNADAANLLAQVVRLGATHMSWAAVGWAIKAADVTYRTIRTQQKTELLWAGPSPASEIPARRIDQVLYDLVAAARHNILLVTFAASRVDRLAESLIAAALRGVRIRLILEFEQTSEGQLSYDALRAFPSQLLATSKVYCWPAEKRDRNQYGRPGKLHAKAAVVDDVALLSSANLTDDAFNRNLELGVCLHGGDVGQNLVRHFNSLIEHGVLVEAPMMRD